MEDEDWVNVEKIARKLNIINQTVHNKAKRMGIRPTRIGTQWFYTEIQARALLTMRIQKERGIKEFNTGVVQMWFNETKNVKIIAEKFGIKPDAVLKHIDLYFKALNAKKEPDRFIILESSMNED